MSPDNKPVRANGAPRPGSRSSLPEIIDTVADGAVHSLAPPAAPERPTAPPPFAPMPKAPPRAYAGPRKLSTAVVSPPLAAPRSPHFEAAGEKTIVGMGPESDGPREDGDRDSGLIAAYGISELYEAEHRRAEALGIQLAKERAKPRVAPPAAHPEPAFDPAATFKLWQVRALKIFLPIAGTLGAIGATFGVSNKVTLEPKVDNTTARQTEQRQTTITLEERVRSLEKYDRALAKYADCIDAERDSAIERGTGHHVSTDHADTEWVESSLPVAKARTLWKSAPWSVSREQPCPSRPAPPVTPTQ